MDIGLVTLFRDRIPASFGHLGRPIVVKTTRDNIDGASVAFLGRFLDGEHVDARLSSDRVRSVQERYDFSMNTRTTRKVWTDPTRAGQNAFWARRYLSATAGERRQGSGSEWRGSA